MSNSTFLDRRLPDLVRKTRLTTEITGTTTTHTRHGHRGQRHDYVHEKWERVNKLGQGGSGKIYLEKHLQDDGKERLRAVKVLKISDNPDCLHELEAMALFSHNYLDNELDLECFVESSGWYHDKSSIHVYLTMEYLEHGDLEQCLLLNSRSRDRVTRELPKDEVQKIVSQVVEGLSYMHEYEVIHGDLKLKNLLVKHLAPDWWVKIGDFGISARVTNRDLPLNKVPYTPGYSAPEIIAINSPDNSDETQRSKYTCAVDIWALGVVSYKLLTGNLPFPNPVNFNQHVRHPGSLSTIPAMAGIEEVAKQFMIGIFTPPAEKRPSAKDLQRSPFLAFLNTHQILMQRSNSLSTRIALSRHPSGASDRHASLRWSKMMSGLYRTSSFDEREEDAMNYPEQPVSMFGGTLVTSNLEVSHPYLEHLAPKLETAEKKNPGQVEVLQPVVVEASGAQSRYHDFTLTKTDAIEGLSESQKDEPHDSFVWAMSSEFSGVCSDFTQPTTSMAVMVDVPPSEKSEGCVAATAVVTAASASHEVLQQLVPVSPLIAVSELVPSDHQEAPPPTTSSAIELRSKMLDFDMGTEYFNSDFAWPKDLFSLFSEKSATDARLDLSTSALPVDDFITREWLLQLKPMTRLAVSVDKYKHLALLVDDPELWVEEMLKGLDSHRTSTQKLEDKRVFILVKLDNEVIPAQIIPPAHKESLLIYPKKYGSDPDRHWTERWVASRQLTIASLHADIDLHMVEGRRRSRRRLILDKAFCQAYLEIDQEHQCVRIKHHKKSSLLPGLVPIIPLDMNPPPVYKELNTDPRSELQNAV